MPLRGRPIYSGGRSIPACVFLSDLEPSATVNG